GATLPVLDHELADDELQWMKSVYADFSQARAAAGPEFNPKEALRAIVARPEYRLSSDAPDLTGRKVARVANAVYAAQSYLARTGRCESDGIDGIDYVARETGSEDSPQARFSRSIAGRVRTIMRVSETVLRVQAASDGLGAALLPCHLGDGQPGLVRLTKPIPELEEDMYMVVHRDLRRVAAVRRAADALGALFRREARVLAGR
ncbi:MAG: LysR substrate-binding domain-containing protein, partial [Rhodospirillales bacterium]